MLTVSSVAADWPVDAAAVSWLKESYVPKQERRVQRLFRKLSALTEREYITDLSAEIILELKAAKWKGLSGEMIIDTSPGIIKVYWDREMGIGEWADDALAGDILFHEIGHFYAVHNGIPGWREFGHGTTGKDHIIIAIANFILENYPGLGHWTWPGELGHL